MLTERKIIPINNKRIAIRSDMKKRIVTNSDFSAPKWFIAVTILSDFSFSPVSEFKSKQLNKHTRRGVELSYQKW